MDEIINYIQVASNGFALLVAGWIYFAYIKNLRSVLSIKDAQLQVVEKNLSFWKEKAKEFEKKTPEYIEDILAKRIEHREKEIKRLAEDKEESIKLLTSKTNELGRLKQELENAMKIGHALTYYDVDSDEEIIIPESDIEIEVLGEVGVDSASLLISDPVYVEQDWRKDIEFDFTRLYRYTKNGKIYQYPRDFEHYDSVIEEIGKRPSELIQAKEFEQIEIEREYTYSYAGAAYASMSKNGYGELPFNNGAPGAGICVRTVYGDGIYQVYGERYKGDLVRIYIDLQ